VAAAVERKMDEVPAFCESPAGHWRKIQTSLIIERTASIVMRRRVFD
jgi:hypothetical protein